MGCVPDGGGGAPACCRRWGCACGGAAACGGDGARCCSGEQCCVTLLASIIATSRIIYSRRHFLNTAFNAITAGSLASEWRQAPDFAKPVVDGNQSVNQSRHVVAAVSDSRWKHAGGDGDGAAVCAGEA
jgi:hypothetical protein